MKKITLLIILLIALAFAYAQDNPWTNYGYYDCANSMAKEGIYLWIGTAGGLVKYNTVTLEKTYYNCANSGLAENYISYIHIDSQGNKWMAVCHNSSSTQFYGTELVKFDGTNWSTFIPPYSQYSIDCIDSDSNGNIWILSHGSLMRFDETNWVEYDYHDTGMEGTSALAVDASDNIWIGSSGHGIGRFNGTNWTVVYPPANDIEEVQNLVFDNDGLLWIGYNSRIASYNGNVWNYIPQGTDIWFGNYATIIPQSSTSIWVGSTTGLIHFNGNTWTNYTTAYPELGMYNLHSICLDNNGTLLVGTKYGLLAMNDNLLNPVEISNNALPSNQIYSLHIDNQDKVTIGARYGLCTYNGTSWTGYDVTNSNQGRDMVTSVTTDNEHNIWFCFYLSVIGKYNGTDFTYYDVADVVPGLGNTIMYATALDHQGNLWFGTSAGLIKYNGDSWTLYNHNNSSYPGGSPEYLSVDSYGNLWIGTQHNGLIKYDGDTWTTFNSDNSPLEYNYIRALFADSDGGIWCACYLDNMQDSGVANLARYADGNWNIYTEEPGGLPSNKITAITQDNNGVMWFGSADGLIKLDDGIWSLIDLSILDLYPYDYISTMACDSQGNVWMGTELSGVFVYDGNTVANDEQNLTIDKAFKIAPNPIRDKTNISFDLDKSSQTDIGIFNLKGQKVITLANATLSKGKHDYNWNLKDANGNKVSSGVYLIKMNSGGKSRTSKCLVLK